MRFVALAPGHSKHWFILHSVNAEGLEGLETGVLWHFWSEVVNFKEDGQGIGTSTERRVGGNLIGWKPEGLIP